MISVRIRSYIQFYVSCTLLLVTVSFTWINIKNFIYPNGTILHNQYSFVGFNRITLNSTMIYVESSKKLCNKCTYYISTCQFHYQKYKTSTLIRALYQLNLVKCTLRVNKYTWRDSKYTLTHNKYTLRYSKYTLCLNTIMSTVKLCTLKGKIIHNDTVKENPIYMITTLKITTVRLQMKVFVQQRSFTYWSNEGMEPKDQIVHVDVQGSWGNKFWRDRWDWGCSILESSIEMNGCKAQVDLFFFANNDPPFFLESKCQLLLPFGLFGKIYYCLYNVHISYRPPSVEYAHTCWLTC